LLETNFKIVKKEAWKMKFSNLNEKIFAEAVEQARIPLINGSLESSIVAAWQDGNEMIKYMKGKDATDASELKNKTILLASISKAITGTAVARLVDQGILHWNDPICKYLCDMKDGSDNEKITVRDIFLHRTGYTNIDVFSTFDASIPPYEAYKLLLKQGMEFKPDTAFHYSTSSYWFVNALVHKALGETSMQKFFEKWLFKPCGMCDTSFCSPPEKRMQILDFHVGADLDKFIASEIPGSGLWSTAEDLLKLGRAVITPGRLFTEKTFNELTTSYPMKKYKEESFSCRTQGWVKELKFNNQPSHGFFHGGATGGVLWCDPEASFIAIFMSNKWGAGNDDAFNVIGAFYR
jgi:CubicO group peptidase (beta-lactamase class C family)